MVPNIVLLGLHNAKRGIFLYRNNDAFYISYLSSSLLFLSSYDVPILIKVNGVVLLCVGS